MVKMLKLIKNYGGGEKSVDLTGRFLPKGSRFGSFPLVKRSTLWSNNWGYCRAKIDSSRDREEVYRV